MSDEASPRPWRVNGHSIEANDPDGLWLQNEKTGWGVVANLPSCPKSRMSKKNRETWDAIVDANAHLIVDAVNERDRLRDIVKRFAKIVGETPIDWFGASFLEKQVLLNEARAAIGEETR